VVKNATMASMVVGIAVVVLVVVAAVGTPMGVKQGGRDTNVRKRESSARSETKRD